MTLLTKMFIYFAIMAVGITALVVLYVRDWIKAKGDKDDVSS